MGAGAVGAARISRCGRGAGLGGWLVEFAQHITPACGANLAASAVKQPKACKADLFHLFAMRKSAVDIALLLPDLVGVLVAYLFRLTYATFSGYFVLLRSWPIPPASPLFLAATP